MFCVYALKKLLILQIKSVCASTQSIFCSVFYLFACIVVIFVQYGGERSIAIYGACGFNKHSTVMPRNTKRNMNSFIVSSMHINTVRETLARFLLRCVHSTEVLNYVLQFGKYLISIVVYIS